MHFELFTLNYTYDYPRPAVSADIVVFRKNGKQVLLIFRKNPPYQGMWALPGGFMEIDETLEHTASRELEEETGLTGIALQQFRTFSQVNRDPRTRVITTVYYGFTLPGNENAKGGDDAAEARWFDINDLPQLGFDHADIINMVCNHIK